MARPVETAPPASTASEEFDPLEFWLRYRSKILLYAGVLLAVGVLYSIFWVVQTKRREHSEQALAAAKTADDFRKVAESYPSNAAGGNALLLLAEVQRKEGKFDDANTTLKSFITKYPKHTLLAGAYASLGANLESQGKLDEALLNYKKVTTSFPTSFAAASAYISQGRVLEAQKKPDDARRAYETVMSQHTESPFSQMASMMLGKLGKAEGKK